MKHKFCERKLRKLCLFSLEERWVWLDLPADESTRRQRQALQRGAWREHERQRHKLKQESLGTGIRKKKIHCIT